jgi:hypothetical protein
MEIFTHHARLQQNLQSNRLETSTVISKKTKSHCEIQKAISFLCIYYYSYKSVFNTNKQSQNYMPPMTYH